MDMNLKFDQPEPVTLLESSHEGGVMYRQEVSYITQEDRQEVKKDENGHPFLEIHRTFIVEEVATWVGALIFFVLGILLMYYVCRVALGYEDGDQPSQCFIVPMTTNQQSRPTDETNPPPTNCRNKTNQGETAEGLKSILVVPPMNASALQELPGTSQEIAAACKRRPISFKTNGNQLSSGNHIPKATNKMSSANHTPKTINQSSVETSNERRNLKRTAEQSPTFNTRRALPPIPNFGHFSSNSLPDLNDKTPTRLPPFPDPLASPPPSPAHPSPTMSLPPPPTPGTGSCRLIYYRTYNIGVEDMIMEENSSDAEGDPIFENSQAVSQPTLHHALGGSGVLNGSQFANSDEELYSTVAPDYQSQQSTHRSTECQPVNNTKAKSLQEFGKAVTSTPLKIPAGGGKKVECTSNVGHISAPPTVPPHQDGIVLDIDTANVCTTTDKQLNNSSGDEAGDIEIEIKPISIFSADSPPIFYDNAVFRMDLPQTTTPRGPNKFDHTRPPPLTTAGVARLIRDATFGAQNVIFEEIPAEEEDTVKRGDSTDSKIINHHKGDRSHDKEFRRMDAEDYLIV